MKNFFLASFALLLIALLGTAIYVYNNPNVVNKITNQDKIDNTESVEKISNLNEQNVNTDDQRNDDEYDVTTSYNQSLMHQNKANLSGQTLAQFNDIWAQLMEHDKNGTLTEAEANIIADQQAMEYSKNNSENNVNENPPKPPSGLTDEEYSEWEKQTYPPQEHNNAAENNQKYAKEHGLIEEE